MIYLEDFLAHYVENIGVNDSNKQILESINKQCKKGTALTDRQYALVKKCLLNVEELDYTGNEPTRSPLREIDRSKYIKIVSHAEMSGDRVYESYKDNWKWIKVRFPFAKKTIVDLEKVAYECRKLYHHTKGSHEHYFRLCEKTIYEVMKVFNKKDFEIDDEVLNYAEQINNIKDNPKNFVPGYWNNELLNFEPHGLESIKNTVPDLDTLKLYDRRKQLGISYITCDIPSGVVGKIVSRDCSSVAISPKEFTLDKVISGLIKLDRFPILAIVDANDELDQITKFYSVFKNIVTNKEQVALFRVDNSATDVYNVNNFIADKGLNNWLDTNTKVVYISKNKLPKLLLKTDWKPQCVLALTGIREHTNVSHYILDRCDLFVCHDEQRSYFKRINFADL